VDKPVYIARSLSVVEAAERLQLAGRTIRKMISSGAFPNAFRLTNSSQSPWKIPERDITVFEEGRVNRV
jgi:predicted DNA-binding transcriptional regulator AlpA